MNRGPRLLGTIERRDGAFGLSAAGGKLFYPLEGNSGIAQDFRESFSEPGFHDLGKRLYYSDGVMVMENAAQRDARRVIEGAR